MDNTEHLFIMKCSPTSRQWPPQAGWCSLPHIKNDLGMSQGTMCTKHCPSLQNPQIPIQPSSHGMCQKKKAHFIETPTLQPSGPAANILVPDTTGDPQRSCIPTLTGQIAFFFLSFQFNGVADRCIFLAFLESSFWTNSQSKLMSAGM